MTKLTLFVFLPIWVSFAYPQEAKITDPKGATTIASAKGSGGIEIVHVKYAKPDGLFRLLSNSGIDVRADNDMKVMFLRGDPASVAAVEQIIHELDVPSSESKSGDVELLVSIIGGSSNSDNPVGGATSEQLAPVIKQLRALFPYSNYRTLGSMLLRSRQEESAQNKGFMASPARTDSNPRPSAYTVQYNRAIVSSDEGKPLIHLNRFQFLMKVPYMNGDRNASTFEVLDVDINADVDLREGQKVVVGKANVENSDSAIFVVLTAQLVS